MPNGKIQRYFRHGTLVQLRVFEAVARHANCTRAAEALHMAQPTVSVHLRKLTDTVGMPLVEYSGKKARLTAAGERLHAACQTIFQTFTELDAAIEDIRGLKSGKLRIATTTAGEYLLPPIVAVFLKQHPDIEVSLHVGSRDALLKRLSENSDDLYLLTNAPATDGVASHAILPNPLIALARSDHPLASERNIAFDRFAQQPMLVRESGSATSLAVNRLFAKHQVQPIVRMELGSNEAIKEAIIAGLGVSLMYRYACGFELDNGLTVLDVCDLEQNGHWHLVYSLGRSLSCVAQAFLTVARSEAKQISDARSAKRGRSKTSAARIAQYP